MNTNNEEKWLSIRRKREICCQFEEIVNQPPVITHPTSLSQKKFLQLLTPSRLFYFNFLRDRCWRIVMGGWLTLSYIWQPFSIFLWIDSQFLCLSELTCFFKCTIKCLLMSIRNLVCNHKGKVSRKNTYLKTIPNSLISLRTIVCDILTWYWTLVYDIQTLWCNWGLYSVIS